MQEPPRELAVLTQARRALAEATSLDDIKAIRDKAEAARKYAESAALGLEMQNVAAELKLRAERKAGQLLRELRLHGGDRRSRVRKSHLRLDQLGISRVQSHRWQLEASVPDEEFEKYVRSSNDRHKELTSVGLVRLAKLISGPEDGQHDTFYSGIVFEGLQLLASKGRQFRCLYVNPPWQDCVSYHPSRRGGPKRRINADQIARLPLRAIGTAESHLHLWATIDTLFEAKRLVQEWGFRYQSCLVRLTPSREFGRYWRESHDFLLLGVRGDLPFRDNSLSSWVEAGGDDPCTKPDGIRELIERVSSGPYLEVFGSQGRTGWTVLG